MMVANVFIQAKNLHDGFDFCPAFRDWLVAQALARDCAVVRHEVPTDTMSRIRIPNACIGLGLRCMSPYQLLRPERARFVPGSGRVAA